MDSITQKKKKKKTQWTRDTVSGFNSVKMDTVLTARSLSTLEMATSYLRTKYTSQKHKQGKQQPLDALVHFPSKKTTER